MQIEEVDVSLIIAILYINDSTGNITSVISDRNKIP